MNDFENLQLSVEDQIAILTINRPDKLNALNKSTLLELKFAIQKVRMDEAIRALVITGKGEKAFIAGADIPEIASLDASSSKSFSENGQEIFKIIEDFPKPVIGAINGYALGGGCELALACHLRIASKNAKFGLPEVSLGIMPAFGGTQRLTLIVGKGKALELMMTGKMISAQEAADIGLINKVVDKQAELLPACKHFLKDILKNAPLSIKKVITSANAAYQKDGYNVESHCFADLIETDDFVEGTKAFIEKRPPQFKGT
jgi:enoyl-CoA hydratase